MAVSEFGDQDAWQRHALITVDDGTTAVQIHALTETIDVDVGERDLDVIDLLNLGQIPKHGSLGLTSLSFEGYAVEVGTASAGTAKGFWDIFAEVPAKDSADPFQVSISRERNRYRVSILWTNDDAATAGSGAVTSGATYYGKRFVIADCFSVGHKLSMTDGILKTTLMFKGPAVDKSNNPNIKMESIGATASALAALASYTPSTSKW